MRIATKRIFPVLLLWILAPMIHGQAVDYNGCDVDADVAPLPQCALEMRSGHVYIAHRYAWMFFAPGTEKLASAQMPDGRWAYFNRNGRIVVQNVAGFNNGASGFHHGLVRVLKNGKYGLANSAGALVVPYRYDGLYEYDQSGKGWLACTGCTAVAGSGGDPTFQGGKWYWLNERGMVARRAQEPETPSSK